MDQLIQFIWDNAIICTLFAFLIGACAGAAVVNALWGMWHRQWDEEDDLSIETIEDADYPPLPW